MPLKRLRVVFEIAISSLPWPIWDSYGAIRGSFLPYITWGISIGKFPNSIFCSLIFGPDA